MSRDIVELFIQQHIHVPTLKIYTKVWNYTTNVHNDVIIPELQVHCTIYCSQ